MYILPYYKIQKGDLHILWLFLTKQGTTIWETDIEDGKNVTLDFVKKEYLIPNGFVGKYSSIKNKNIVLCEMSTVNFDDYYLYTDTNAADEVWRPFFMVCDAGWEQEGKKIKLGTFGTLQNVWDLVFTK